MRGEQRAVGDDERVEARVLGRAGQRCEVRGIAEGLFKSEHPSAGGRCGSEVEQEFQRPRDPEERLVVNATDPRDEPLI